MATLTIAQAIAYAQQAGFSGAGLVTIVSIAKAESGLRTDVNSAPNNDVWGSIDRGIVQMNSHWHPEVSNACAYDPLCSFKAAFRISSGGTNFNAWSTFKNGSYKQFTGIVQGTGPQKGTLVSGPWIPTFIKDLGAWINNPSIWMYGRWLPGGPSRNEGGVDLGSTGGTPVYALADGVIMGAGNFWHSPGNPGYGVITTRVNVPGSGLQDLYYQHIDIASNINDCTGSACNGQVVHKGDIIGHIHPGVNMLELGFNAGWGGIWGTNHPGAWATDPRPMLKALVETGPPGATVSGVVNPLSSSTSSLPSTDVVTSIMSALGIPNAAAVQDFIQRMGFVFVGGMIILIAVLVMFFSSDAGKSALGAGSKAAMVAA